MGSLYFQNERPILMVKGTEKGLRACDTWQLRQNGLSVYIPYDPDNLYARIPDFSERYIRVDELLSDVLARAWTLFPSRCSSRPETFQDMDIPDALLPGFIFLHSALLNHGSRVKYRLELFDVLQNIRPRKGGLLE